MRTNKQDLRQALYQRRGSVSLVPILLFFLGFANYFITNARAPLHAQQNSYTLTTAASIGFLHGHAEEFLYKGSNGEYLSQLLWNMRPLFFHAYSATFEQKQPLARAGFFLTFAAKIGIPGTTGSMEDRDWLDSRDHRLTNFSTHENRTRRAMLFDIKAGASIPLFRRIVLKARGVFSLMDFSWEAYNGYSQYAERNPNTGAYNEWDASLPKKPMRGKVITYKQQWLIAGAGVSLTIPVSIPNGSFFISFAFDISPLVICSATDNHWQRTDGGTLGLQFNDYMKWGIFLEPSISFGASLGAHTAFTFSTAYRLARAPIGDSSTYKKYETSTILTGTSPNSAGAAISYFHHTLSLTLSF